MEYPALFVKQNDRFVRINLNDILFLQAQGSYSMLVTTSVEFVIAKNLSQFLKRNSFRTLLRVHRSFAVNLACIDSFDQNFVYIAKTQIPLGENYRPEFLKSVLG